MAHLLAMSVPVKRDPAWSDWAKMARSRIKLAGIPVNKWQLLYYHMTILYLDDDECAETFTPELAQIVKACPALPMTIDKLDAFTTSNGAEHIIYLSSTNVPPQILTLANNARTLADSLNGNYDKRPFKPHITFGHVPADKMSLDQLQTLLRAIEQPAFNCVLNEVEHRYRRSNGTIKRWKLL